MHSCLVYQTLNILFSVVLNDIAFTVTHMNFQMWCLELVWPTLFESDGGGLGGGSLVHSLTRVTTHRTRRVYYIVHVVVHGGLKGG